MFETTRRRRTPSLAKWLMLTTALSLHAAVAHAQSNPSVPQQARSDSQRSPQIDYAIPAGPLAQALNRFADASGLQLISGAETTRGLASPGLNGRFTARAALARLLDGTGLTYRYTGARTVSIRGPAGNECQCPGRSIAEHDPGRQPTIRQARCKATWQAAPRPEPRPTRR